jgi:hypothetical protein
MTATVPTWGYRKGESRIFELPAGAGLPEGWYDSPMRIPAAEPGTGGERQSGSPHPPSGVSPPPAATIDDQERAEYVRAVAENTLLKERIAELEARLALYEPEPQPPIGDLPPPPAGEQPRIGEVLSNLDLGALRQRATELGIKVDMRWGAHRLQQEIEAAGKADR